jgi:hypothetical protein
MDRNNPVTRNEEVASTTRIAHTESASVVKNLLDTESVEGEDGRDVNRRPEPQSTDAMASPSSTGAQKETADPGHEILDHVAIFIFPEYHQAIASLARTRDVFQSRYHTTGSPLGSFHNASSPCGTWRNSQRMK